MDKLTWPRRTALVLAAIFYVGAGVLHFIKTGFI
jgi:hypothetical protein